MNRFTVLAVALVGGVSAVLLSLTGGMWYLTSIAEIPDITVFDSRNFVGFWFYLLLLTLIPYAGPVPRKRTLPYEVMISALLASLLFFGGARDLSGITIMALVGIAGPLFARHAFPLTQLSKQTQVEETSTK